MPKGTGKGPVVTFAGTRPKLDGVTDWAERLLDDETGPQMVPIVGLLSRSKRIRDDDRSHEWVVVTYRQIEVADDPDDVKDLTEVLGRIYAKRMARSGVQQLPLGPPMEPGERFDRERDYGPGASDEEDDDDAEAAAEAFAAGG